MTNGVTVVANRRTGPLTVGPVRCHIAGILALLLGLNEQSSAFILPRLSILHSGLVTSYRLISYFQRERSLKQFIHVVTFGNVRRILVHIIYHY